MNIQRTLKGIQLKIAKHRERVLEKETRLTTIPITAEKINKTLQELNESSSLELISACCNDSSECNDEFEKIFSNIYNVLETENIEGLVDIALEDINVTDLPLCCAADMDSILNRTFPIGTSAKKADSGYFRVKKEA